MPQRGEFRREVGDPGHGRGIDHRGDGSAPTDEGPRLTRAASNREREDHAWDDHKIDDPEAAAQVRDRRTRAAIPDEVRHREKWRLALDIPDQMLTPPGDELAGGWGLPKRPVVGDSGYGDATEFRLGLTERELAYVLQVDSTATAHPVDAVPATAPPTGRGRPPKPRYHDEPITLRELALASGRAAWRRVTWRNGSKNTKDNPTAAMRSHFLAIRVRPANRHIPRAADGGLPEE